jgi:hypothetical protein
LMLSSTCAKFIPLVVTLTRPDLRQEYFFVDQVSPFPNMVDLVEALDPDVQSRVDHTVISRFMALSNLTTFVWIVLHPDECWDLVPAFPDDTEQRGSTSRTRRTRGKRPVQEESEDEELQELRGRIRRRNDVLRRAWKEWWLVVNPKENRSSKEGIRLWLELLTQVCNASP